MKKRYLVLIGLFLLCIAVLPARGNREKPEVIQVTGTVRLVGTALFPEIIISNQETYWYIAGDETRLLYDLQHRIVTVEGEEALIELTYASGLPAGTRRELRNVKIIKIEGG